MRASEPAGRLIRYLPALTLTAVLTITATAEFELARTVLALPPHIAWALPVAVDSYVLAAMRSGRDIPAALVVMAGALGASMGAHLAVVEHGGTLPPHVVAPAATGIMTVLVIVAWRVHVLIGHSPAPSTESAAVDGARPVGAPLAQIHPEPQPIEQPKPQSARANRQEPTDKPAGRPTVSAAKSATKPSPSDDEQLIAEAAEHFRQAGIYPPSIRALMRTYSLGQTRATRIHAAITSTTDRPTDRPTDRSTDRSNAQQHQHDERASQERHKAGPSDESSESAINTKELTHTCITDRVGPAPAAPGMRAADSGDSHQSQELTVVRRLSANGKPDNIGAVGA